MIKKCPVCGNDFITTNAVKFCSNACRRKHQDVERPPKKRVNETLCWTCKNAVLGCSWSKSFTPVEGWTANKTILGVNIYTGKLLESYFVKKCPGYVPDDK